MPNNWLAMPFGAVIMAVGCLLVYYPDHASETGVSPSDVESNPEAAGKIRRTNQLRGGTIAIAGLLVFGVGFVSLF